MIKIYKSGGVPRDIKEKYVCCDVEGNREIMFYQFINWPDETANRWNTVEYDVGYIGEAGF